MQCLAGEYLLAVGCKVEGRIAQIKHLLRDALSAFAAENEPDAMLITALVFGDSQYHVTKSAGELSRDESAVHPYVYAFSCMFCRVLLNEAYRMRGQLAAARSTTPPPRPR